MPSTVPEDVKEMPLHVFTTKQGFNASNKLNKGRMCIDRRVFRVNPDLYYYLLTSKLNFIFQLVVAKCCEVESILVEVSLGQRECRPRSDIHNGVKRSNDTTAISEAAFSPPSR